MNAVLWFVGGVVLGGVLGVFVVGLCLAAARGDER
jgi:hypothetical protein